MLPSTPNFSQTPDFTCKCKTLRAKCPLRAKPLLSNQISRIVQDLKLSGIFTSDGQGVNKSQRVNKCINIAMIYINLNMSFM